jgi:hypothetical protein
VILVCPGRKNHMQAPISLTPPTPLGLCGLQLSVALKAALHNSAAEESILRELETLSQFDTPDIRYMSGVVLSFLTEEERRLLERIKPRIQERLLGEGC